MQTKYEPERRSADGDYGKGHRRRNRRERLAMLRLIACLLLLGSVGLLKVFFPGAAATVGTAVRPMIEHDIDYRGSIAAIGETIAGEGTILEALGEMTIRAFGGVALDITEPEELEGTLAATHSLPEYTPAAANIPIELAIPMPTAPPQFAPRPMPKSEEEEESGSEETKPEERVEAVEAFLAHQAIFDYTIPASVVDAYVPLDLEFTVPVMGPVSSGFGFRRHPIEGATRFHFGTDVAVDTGTPFGAFAAGRVMSAGYGQGFGLYILMDHGDGIKTRYAHCSVLYVQAGDWVEKGQVIGRVGYTGNATGPHLHFELMRDGMFLNPELYVMFA